MRQNCIDKVENICSNMTYKANFREVDCNGFEQSSGPASCHIILQTKHFRTKAGNYREKTVSAGLAAGVLPVPR